MFQTQYGDALVLARRQEQMTLAAELRGAMLPPTTSAPTGSRSPASWNRPTRSPVMPFDYAFNSDILHWR